MLIEAIRLRNVRRFGEEGVRVEGLTAGLNVLAAPNESGKSTVVDALEACLTVAHTHRKPIASLIPVSGGSPWIELDIVTPDGAFRVEKRFTTERFAKVTARDGRIVAQAGDADEWLRAAVGANKTGEGPIGLVWVRQEASTERPAVAGARGETLRHLVGEQVSGVVGGQQAQQVMRATRARLADYLTAQTNRIAKRGPLGEVQARVVDLEEKMEKLRTKTALTRRRAEELAKMEQELSRLESTSEVSTLGKSLSEAEAAQQEAVRRNAALEGERSEAARTADRSSAAGTAVATLEQEQAAAAAAERAFEQAKRSADVAESEKAACERKAETVRTASSEAERTREAAAKAVAEARRHADAGRASEELERVSKRLSEARTASKALAALPPPAAPIDLDRLRKLRDAVTNARAHAEAARATIRVEMAEDLLVDGREACSDEIIVVSRTIALTAGAARVVVEPPRTGGTAPEAALTEAERAFSDALTRVGAADFGEATAAMEAGLTRDREAVQYGKELERAAPDGMASLEAEIRALEVRAGKANAGAPVDVAHAEAAHADADAQAADARGVLTQTERVAADARTAAVGTTASLAAAETRAREAIERAGCLDEREERLATARQSLAAATAAAAAAKTRLEAAEAELPDLGTANDRVKALREAQNNRAKKVTELRERRAELGQAVRSDYEGDAAEALSRIEGELDVAREEESRETIELEALQLLEATLGAAHADRLERFLAPVTAELAPLVDVVFPGAALNLDGELSLEGLRRGERNEALEILSGGTREQLAILTKLAFARFLAKSGRRVPVVMDDALVFADDDRLDRMFRAVRMAASDTQVIALTCRTGAYESLGGNAISLSPLS